MRIWSFCSLIRCFAGEVPNIVFISGEFEYHSRETFPEFARGLEREYKVKRTVLKRPEDEKLQAICGLHTLADAHLVVLFAYSLFRRRGSEHRVYQRRV